MSLGFPTMQGSIPPAELPILAGYCAGASFAIILSRGCRPCCSQATKSDFLASRPNNNEFNHVHCVVFYSHH